MAILLLPELLCFDVDNNIQHDLAPGFAQHSVWSCQGPCDRNADYCFLAYSKITSQSYLKIKTWIAMRAAGEPMEECVRIDFVNHCLASLVILVHSG